VRHEKKEFEQGERKLARRCAQKEGKRARVFYAGMQEGRTVSRPEKRQKRKEIEIFGKETTKRKGVVPRGKADAEGGCNHLENKEKKEEDETRKTCPGKECLFTNLPIEREKEFRRLYKKKGHFGGGRGRRETSDKKKEETKEGRGVSKCLPGGSLKDEKRVPTQKNGENSQKKEEIRTLSSARVQKKRDRGSVKSYVLIKKKG